MIAPIANVALMTALVGLVVTLDVIRAGLRRP